MFDSDLSDMDKGKLAIIGGFGLFAIGFFFYFFMTEDYYQDIYVLALMGIIFGVLMILFYLLDDLKFMFSFAMGRDDPEGFKDNLRKGTNALAGGMGMIVLGVNIIAFQNYGLDKGLRILVISLLTIFSVFLLLYSLLVED